MSDNGSHIEFVPGPQAGMVRVWGDHRLSVDRTLKAISQIVCLAARRG